MPLSSTLADLLRPISTKQKNSYQAENAFPSYRRIEQWTRFNFPREMDNIMFRARQLKFEIKVPLCSSSESIYLNVLCFLLWAGTCIDSLWLFLFFKGPTGLAGERGEIGADGAEVWQPH